MIFVLSLLCYWLNLSLVGLTFRSPPEATVDFSEREGKPPWHFLIQNFPSSFKAFASGCVKLGLPLIYPRTENVMLPVRPL